ncbi:hypothetical protein QMK19_35140, partial [Streptomyces sp. H10-C2]|uniref:hypothetical protein n=1 Tax=unclassified Streptomyces TaxID=2593676 RepID=UPI0024B96DCF
VYSAPRRRIAKRNSAKAELLSRAACISLRLLFLFNPLRGLSAGSNRRANGSPGDLLSSISVSESGEFELCCGRLNLAYEAVSITGIPAPV